MFIIIYTLVRDNVYNYGIKLNIYQAVFVKVKIRGYIEIPEFSLLSNSLYRRL